MGALSFSFIYCGIIQKSKLANYLALFSKLSMFSKYLNPCVDFSFCCVVINPSDSSLKQNIAVVSRQAFILY